MSSIKCNNLNIKYGISTKLNVVFNKGDFIALIGQNGVGKSTLLKSILNIVKYDGSIILENISNRDIGYLPQTFNEINNLSFTVKNIFIYTLKSYKFIPYLNKVDMERLNAIKDEFNLDYIWNKTFKTLSGGEKQRILIAQQFIQPKKVMLLDEPFNHVDYKTQITIYSLLNKLHKRYSLITIIITHTLQRDILNFFNKVLYISQDNYLYVDKDDICKYDSILRCCHG